jgi:ACS family tartrate transporter-like MFS transporter
LDTALGQPGIAERTRSSVTRRVMPFLFLLYIIAYVDRINISFAGLQMTSDLKFTDEVFGFGSGIFFAGYVLLGIPGALLVERWSARKTMASAMAVWGLVASATGLIHTAGGFYTMRFLLGVTEAGFFPGMITYLGHWYTRSDRAKAVAMFMAAIPVSKTIASPISAGLMQAHWLGLAGWRWLLILEGAPAVMLAAVTWIYLTDRPRHARWLAADEREWLTKELEKEAASASPAGRESLWSALRNPNVLLLCGTYFGGTVADYGLGLWLPKFIQRMSGMSVTLVALTSAIPSLVSIPAMLFWGWRSDRTGERRVHTAIPRFTAAVALAAIALFDINVPIAIVLFSIASCGVMAAYPSLWAMPTTFLSAAAAAASIGMINSFGNLGGFAGPYLIGFFSSRNGSYTGGMWTMTIALVISGLCVLAVRSRR